MSQDRNHLQLFADAVEAQPPRIDIPSTRDQDAPDGHLCRLTAESQRPDGLWLMCTCSWERNLTDDGGVWLSTAGEAADEHYEDVRAGRDQ
jgi:hypothetical protein